MSIPLPHRPISDSRIWSGDRSGLYFVRSGYKWLISSKLGVSWDLNAAQDDWLESNVHLLRDCSFVNGVCAGLGITLTAPSTNQDWLKWLADFLVSLGVHLRQSAEALACLQALVFAQELGFHRIIVEGDSFIVVSKLSNSMIDFSSISPILFSIKDRVRDFDLISFVHVNRARNQAAHSLASFGKNFSSPQVWIEEVPPSVDLFAQRDRRWIDPPV
ncbi:hypothetical protein V6N13_005787 [Hibiscus sabdariffa]|uniref:RNase H type-1 domain-containing protein n=1 Tax=Hibiscus sabdariffa TaxID=183260 RepID=A0ABR2EPQ6_9ROSI